MTGYSPGKTLSSLHTHFEIDSRPPSRIPQGRVRHDQVRQQLLTPSVDRPSEGPTEISHDTLHDGDKYGGDSEFGRGGWDRSFLEFQA